MFIMHIDIFWKKSMRLLHRAVLVFAVPVSLTAMHGTVLAQAVPGNCGVLQIQGRFGPYDYRPSHYIPEGVYRSHAALLNVVESAHFTPEVEANFRGKTGTSSGPDITYTLHVFPNHHRALLSMVALGEKEHTDKPTGSPYVIECWFTRAIAFRPDDHIVRMIYASFLVNKNRNDDADAQLRIVAEHTENTAFTYRNIGLIYCDMKRYDEALKFAHKSMALGLPGGPLQEKLIAAGKWVEPPEDKAPAPTKQ